MCIKYLAVHYLASTDTHFPIDIPAAWVLIASAGGVGGVVSGRVLGGVCVGVQAVVGSVFMPEMIQVEHRNLFAAFPAFFGNLGEYTKETYISARCYRLT